MIVSTKIAKLFLVISLGTLYFFFYIFGRVVANLHMIDITSNEINLSIAGIRPKDSHIKNIWTKFSLLKKHET